MFWFFEQRRKIRNAEHHREKREALINLISKIIKTDNKKEEI